jgi:hypothetical protein
VSGVVVGVGDVGVGDVGGGVLVVGLVGVLESGVTVPESDPEEVLGSAIYPPSEPVDPASGSGMNPVSPGSTRARVAVELRREASEALRPQPVSDTAPATQSPTARIHAARAVPFCVVMTAS